MFGGLLHCCVSGGATASQPKRYEIQVNSTNGLVRGDHDANSEQHTNFSLDQTAQVREIGKDHIWRLSDLELLTTVGMGTFGRVRLVKSRITADKTPMALKMMKKSEIIKQKQVEHVRSEREILSRLSHPFTVNLFATFQDTSKIYMLMEFVNGGELFSLLSSVGCLPNDHARIYAGEVTLAFEYMHSINIIYRDLKPENLLIDSGGHMKITDFGFAKAVEHRTWTLCGTPEYLAPEIIQNKGHGKGADYWALGILIYEMLAGHSPFRDDSAMGIYRKIIAGKVEYPRHFSATVEDLISRLLVTDKAQRLGCLLAGVDGIKIHSWNDGLDFERVLRREIQPPFVPKVKSMDDTSLYDSYPESREGSTKPPPQDKQRCFEGF